MGAIYRITRKLYGYMARKKDPVVYARQTGVKVGERCIFNSSVNFGTEPWLISIGNHVEITGGVCFITHDGATWVIRDIERYKDVLRYGQIKIEDNVFIGWGSIILPNVTIGKNAVIAAGSVVTKDVLPNTVVGGNPAKVISTFEEYAEKCLRETPRYNKENYKKNKKEEVLYFFQKNM